MILEGEEDSPGYDQGRHAKGRDIAFGLKYRAFPSPWLMSAAVLGGDPLWRAGKVLVLGV